MEPKAMQIGTDVLVQLRNGRHVLIKTNAGNSSPEPSSVQTGTEAADHDSGNSNPPAPAGDSPTAPPATQEQKQTFGELISGIINFVTLGARFIALAAAAMWLKEKLHILKAHMHRDAANARKVSEMCGQAGVDGRFLAQILEVSQAFDRVAEASGVLADAADQMEANARGVKDAHQAEYGGVYEAVNSSPYDQPKPGFSAVR